MTALQLRYASEMRTLPRMRRTHARVKIWGVHTGSVRATNIKQGRMVVRFHLSRRVSIHCCCS